MAHAEQRKAVFLDRDGTINVEKEYLHRAEDFEFIPGAPEAVRMLKDAGFLVIVVTNQSGIARGYYDRTAVDRLHEHVARELQRFGTSIDAYYICPHHPEHDTSAGEECRCRKPLPGMLLEAAKTFAISMSASFMVGDKEIDVAAGLAAGCQPILVKTGYGAREVGKLHHAVPVVQDLRAAAELIVSNPGTAYPESHRIDDARKIVS